MDTWLSPDEVFQLTARTRWSAQCRALAKMGVPFKPNAVGRPLVERATVIKGGHGKSARAPIEPDWSAIGGKAA